jgi:ATP synthase protein I
VNRREPGEFRSEVGKKERRRLAAQKRTDDERWFGLGMLGLVGWSFSIPVLIFLALGIWIDATRQTDCSWALMFLGIGVVAGGANAWFWISNERRHIEEDQRNE